MANNPNSFYIGVPTTSVQPPVNYDSPKYIQVIGSSNSVEDVSDYYGWSMTLTTSTGASSLYIVHYCDAQSSGYNSNWTSYASQGKIFAHNGSGQYYNSIDSLPAGTKYWTARTDATSGIEPNAWPNDFGNENDWGRYNVEVYLFNDALVAEEKTTITLEKTGGSGGTDTVYGINGKYLPSITIPTRTKYLFVGYGNISNGSGTGTLYYDSSGNPTRNWDKTGGTATLYAKWRNTVTYNPYNGSCWAVNASTPGTATTGSRTITIASSSSCASGGAITFSISSSTDISGWTISSDGKTLTVPSNTPVGVYSINIKAISQSSSSVTGYMVQSITRTISITVKSGGAEYSGIYITPSAYDFTASSTSGYSTPELDGYGQYYTDTTTGEVVEPGPMEFSWFMPIVTDDGSDRMIPAGQITIDGSNIGNYISTLIYGYQKIKYKDGTEEWVEVPLVWGGSHTFESLGTESLAEQVTKFGRHITFTFNGGDNQVVTFNLDDYLSSSTDLEGYNYPIYREANSCTWGTPSVSTTYQTKYPSGGGKIVLSKENIIISNQEGVWTSSSVSTNTSLTKLQFTKTTSASGFTPKIENNDTANATLTNEASATSSARTGNKITIKAYGEGDKYATVYAEFSQNGPNGITITSSCPQTIYSRSGYNTCTVSVTGATGTVSYASLNTSVATVTSSGVVTYVGPGTATIRVSATGNENIDSKYVDCQVNCVEDTYTCTITKPSISQSNDLPCSGITLTTDTITDYFSASATVNRTWASGYTDTASPSSYTWTITKGEVASRGTTIDNNKTNVSINIKVTANYNSCSSQSDAVTSGRQAANPITFYGAVGTPTITQEKEFPCGGVTLTTDNISTYFSHSSVTQQVTLCSGSKINISATGYTWSGSNVSIPSLGKTTTSGVTERKIDFTITAKGGENKSATATVSKGNQAANPASVTWNDISITTYKYPNIGAGGGTSNPTISASQSGTRTWCSGENEGLTGTLSYSYSMSTGNGFSINTSTGVITAENRDKNDGDARTSNTATVTVTGEGSKTADKKATCTQDANTHSDSWNKPDVTSVTYSYPNISACGGTSKPSVGGTITQSGTRTWTSGATEPLSNNTLSSFTKSYSMQSGNGFNINTSTGVISQANPRGRSTNTLSSNDATLTLSANGKSATKTAKATQSGNTYTDSWPDISVTYSYPTISACGDTVNPTFSVSQGDGTRTWGCDEGTDPLPAPTLSYSFSMETGNGFSIDTTNGKMTCDARGKYDTPRTSNTATVTVTGGGGGKTATKTAKATQSGNTYTDSWPDISVTYSYPNISACGGTSTPNVSVSQGKGTRTWGCKAGTDSLTAPTLSISYSLPTPNGFTINSSTGVITAPGPQGPTTSPRSCTAKVSVTGGGGGKTATKTATTTQSGNTYSDSWEKPVISKYSYATNPISACGGNTGNPTVTVSQKGTRTWGCNVNPEPLTNTSFSYSYSIDAKTGLNIDSSTGVITGTAIGKSDTGRTTTATVTVAANGKTATETTTVTQSGNTYTVSWDAPSISVYSYSDITAGGGTSEPTITVSQSGTRTWGCNAGTDPLTNDSFTYSYSMSTGNGFSINTSTGAITAEDRYKNDGDARTSNTATVTVTGEGSKTANKKATCTQVANTHSDSWEDPTISEYSYPAISACGNETVSPTVTASQSGTRTWTSGATEPLSNNTLSSFTKSYSMQSGNGFSIDISTGAIKQANSRGRSDQPLESNDATVTVTGFGGKTATKTTKATQSGNTYTTSWEEPVISRFSYSTISACGGHVSPSVRLSQTGTRTWECNAGTEDVTNKNFTRRYSIEAKDGFRIISSTSGSIRATAIGQSEYSRSTTVTLKVTANGKSSTMTTTVTQSGNTYTDSFDEIIISEYSYPDITAAGGTSEPTITVSQNGTRTWDCNAGTSPVTNSDFTYSYSMETKDGFSIDTSTGDITAENRGTTPGVARTSNTETVTVTGGGNMTKYATATCTQGANELEGITLTVGSKTIAYQGTTKGTVTARYTSGSTKDVENDTNTSYTANPNIVTFNKTS